MPQILRKIRALSWRDRWLLTRVTLLLAGIRLSLILLPFHRVAGALERLGRPNRLLSDTDREGIDRIVGAVSVTSQYVPGAKCLERALAAKVLLSAQGHRVDLRIGVDRPQGAPLEAHAWLEDDGRIVIGHVEDLGRYTPLPVLELGPR
jgi:hypothetical protein